MGVRAGRMGVGVALVLSLLVACLLLLPPARSGAAEAGSAQDDRALALLFRPRLFFDTKEPWRPVDVDAFLAEPGHAACPPKGVVGVCQPLSDPAQLTPSVGYLDLRGTRVKGEDAVAPDLATCARSAENLRDCDEGGRSVIYANVERDGARTAIDYWWFLRYNAFSRDRHEGDWEGATVIVDAAGTQVLEVHYAAHKGVWRYRGEVPRIVGSHPLVFVARGSHASYPRRCAHRLFPCRQTGSPLPEARFDGKRPWVGNSALGCRRRCVKLLPERAGAPASWDAWNGRWGIPTLFPPPLTPAFQGRYRHPFDARPSGRRFF